ncbi:hypothetical protein [Streptomyces sp. NPDC055632]
MSISVTSTARPSIPALTEQLAQLVLDTIGQAPSRPPARPDTYLYLSYAEGCTDGAAVVTDDDLPQEVAVHLTAPDQPDIPHDHHHATPP